MQINKELEIIFKTSIKKVKKDISDCEIILDNKCFNCGKFRNCPRYVMLDMYEKLLGKGDNL